MAERIQVSESADDYEKAIAGAMLKMKNRLSEEAQVHRNYPQCEEMRDWYIQDVEGVLTPGEQLVMVHVTFELAGSDL